jgi:hypothetical protein
MTWATATVLPALLVGALTVGCSGDKKDDGDKPAKTDKDKKKGEKGKREQLASTGWGTIKGRVTFDGDKPDLKAANAQMLEKIEANQDKKHCLDGASDREKGQQLWHFGPNNGVGDVFVWLAPPDGKYFKIDWDKKPWRKEVKINQPHCAFTPHAEVLFPGAYEEDLENLKSSDQTFIVTNTAQMNHNTKWAGGDNPGDNKTISPGSTLKIPLKPDSKPVTLTCNIHTFMGGLVRVFDHPYAAVTKEDGSFEIKDAPAGAELRVIVWHESDVYGGKGKEGDKVTLEAGKDTEKNYTIKAK